MKAVAEAPAKVIITGEHFVVYGGLALASAIDLKARVEAIRGDSISIVSLDYGIRCSKSSTCDPRLKPLLRLLEEVAADNPRCMGEFRIRSAIPPSAGLGSSASIAVALAAAALTLAKGTPLNLNEVYDYAMIAEKEIHGRPSGIDPAIATWGGVILYSLSEGVKRVPINKTLDIIVCDTGRARSTKEMIEKVKSFKDGKPLLFRSLLQSSSELTRLAAHYLSTSDLNRLAPIIRWHQQALSILGVSTPEIDCVIRDLSILNIAAKITGAGGGGCVIGFPTDRGPGPSNEYTIKGCSRLFKVKMPVGGVKSWMKT